MKAISRFVLAGVVLAALAAGCCPSGGQRCRVAVRAPSNDLLFNPYVFEPHSDVARSTWPSTELGDALSRDTTYSIRIIDIQDPWLHGRSSYYRRAEAWQQGRSRH